ncbi:chromosome segregation protein SMC [Adhaeribacter arboris]|uniref:Chromosome segregation protein SMC n=1 Tax=Adhaeribacter arboris TaxID=2072846 RepID=A0A2T2YKZ9_9BACT|nr:AAA family ATPase [Adhaeribacter arboris]PSR56145.1 chromosome segregation protein SMC [Adhaeribacter arboris]
MKVSKIELVNFKRFTDLTISDIPETAKLVLLIGSNGSGKSSLFDAFDWLNVPYKARTYSDDEASDYYQKKKNEEPKVVVKFTSGDLIEKTGYNIIKGTELVKKFIGRSSIRIVPRNSNDANPSAVSTDMDSPITYIENDTRFINDVFLYIQKINQALREPVFSGKQADTLKIFRDFIEPLNSSLLKIFGGDETTTIQIAEFQDATPRTPAKLIFKKGESKINYDLLSHGEKQVIILLINFIARKEYYSNSIIFIDEMDNHLNTALQASLLEEIVTKWISDDSQLWTASHALGFIDYARNSDIASIIDLNLINFDTKQELIPLSKNKLEVYEIAIPKATIASILKGYKLVIVENKNDEYFNSALGQDGFLFLPANNNREVFLTVKSDKDKLGLRDRDYLKSEEIEKIRGQLPNLKILLLSTFENYIYHPDNFGELRYAKFDKEEYIAEILRQKNEKLIDVVSEIGTSRTHYIEFKDCIKDDGNIKPITEALKSNIFDDFYPFFNMKKHFNKKYLTRFNYTISDLAKTQWFRGEILRVLNS